MNAFRRTIAFLLCLVLCFSLLPVMVLAEEEQPAEVTLEETILDEETPALETEEPSEEPAEEPIEAPVEEPAEESLEPVSEEAPALLTPDPDTNLLTKDYFPDINLLAALKKQYPNGLTLTAAEQVDDLYLNGLGISDAAGLEYFSNLDTLFIADNNLTTLELSAFPKLSELDCGNNRLTELGISGNDNLQYLYCDKNALTSLDLSACTALDTLICSENALGSLNVSACIGLEWLECDYNALTKLDVSDHAWLELLSCSNNALTEIDFREGNDFHYLNCSGNMLVELPLDGCTVERLYCAGNHLSVLPLDEMTEYPGILDCSRNSILSLPQEYLAGVTNIPYDETGYDLTMDSQVAPATLDAIYCDAARGGNNADTLLIDTAALRATKAGRSFLEAWSSNYTSGTPNEVLNAEGMTPAYCLNWDEGYIQYMLIPAAAVQNGSIYLQQGESGPVVELPLNLLPATSDDNAEYLLLSPGNSVTIPYTLPFAGLAEYIEENPSPMILTAVFFDAETMQQDSRISTAITADGISISVSSDMAAQSGRVLVMAAVRASSGDLDYSSSFFFLGSPIRVDIAGESLTSAVKAVTLGTTKVTDEYFKTDRAEITVIPELDMNARVQSPEAEDNVGIQSAEFSDAVLKELYTLTVKDDRTLVLEPNPAAGYAVLTGATKIAGTYKSTIKVTIGDAFGSDTFETAAQVAVTVKTSQPKLKASALKLNSTLPAQVDAFGRWVVSGIGTAMKISGGTVKGYTYFGSDSAAIDHTVVPGVEGMTQADYYDYFDEYKMAPAETKWYYAGEAGAKLSGTAFACVSLEGWTDAYHGWPVKVKVSVAPIAPTLKLSSKSVTVYTDNTLSSYTEIKLTPSAAYADRPISISRMIETRNKQAYTYTGYYYNGVSEIEGYDLDAEIKQVNGETYLRIYCYSKEDCTAKLYLELAGKEFPVSIKVKGSDKNKVSAAVKATGTIDTMLPYSKLDLQATLKNVGNAQPVAALYVTKIYSEKKGTDPVVYYAYNPEGTNSPLDTTDTLDSLDALDTLDTRAFSITEGEDLTATIRLLDASQLDPTRTYYAETLVRNIMYGPK